jgi:1-acyl-sn-glycerol-3-phosphate acyltransferase
MAKRNNPVVNDCVPLSGNRFTRGLSELVLKLMGWRITGVFPQEKKLVFIGCPHTSNWDLILALSAMKSVGLKASWMMKKEAFFWPLGPIWKKLGGVPIDRKSKNDITTQMANWFKSQDKAYLGITPEGTRSRVEQLKKGYLRIAYAAKVPVFLVAIDAIKKEVVLDKLWALTGDIEADNRAIKQYYDDNYVGIRPN